MANNTSQHILGTSTNLLGFCLFIITSLHIGNKTQNSFVDEFASIIALVLIFSCIFSFLSIKTNNDAAEQRLEKIAEYLFMLALITIFGIVAFLIFNFWNK